MLGAVGMRIYLILLLLLAGCATRHESEWHRYDAGEFSFSLPPGLKKTAAHGIDSYVSEFESPSMELSFDYGFYSNNFQGWPDSTSYEMATVDGRQARIGTAFGSFERGFTYHTQIYFREVRPTVHLSMVATCKTQKDCDIAKRVFCSIAFKQEPQ